MRERLKGVWSFACSNGRTASGELVSYGIGKGGAGRGQDANGNIVSFVVDRR